MAIPFDKILVDAKTQAQTPNSDDFTTEGGFVTVTISVATTTTESRRVGVIMPKTTFRVERASNVLSIKWKDMLGAYHVFTEGIDDEANWIFACTDTSAATVTIQQMPLPPL